MIERWKILATLAVLGFLVFGGCSRPQRGYAPTDEFFASGRFPTSELPLTEQQNAVEP